MDKDKTMSTTTEEAAYEDYMSQLYEEHKKEAIEEFTGERLQSYYLNNRLLAQPAFDALTESRKLNCAASDGIIIFFNLNKL